MSNPFDELLEEDQEQEDKIHFAITQLTQYIKGIIPLTVEDLEDKLNLICTNPMAIMNFLHLMGGRLQTAKLSDNDRDKIYQACCQASEPALWFMIWHPDSYLRSKAFDSVCKHTRTSMQFRMEKMYNTDVEKYNSIMAAIRHYGNVSAFIQGPYDLDIFEKKLMINTILEHKDVDMASRLYKGNFDKYCKFTLDEKELVIPFLLSEKLVKGI